MADAGGVRCHRSRQRDPRGAVLPPHNRILVGVGAGARHPGACSPCERLRFCCTGAVACSRGGRDLRRDGLVHRAFPCRMPGDHLAVPMAARLVSPIAPGASLAGRHPGHRGARVSRRRLAAGAVLRRRAVLHRGDRLLADGGGNARLGAGGGAIVGGGRTWRRHSGIPLGFGTAGGRAGARPDADHPVLLLHHTDPGAVRHRSGGRARRERDLCHPSHGAQRRAGARAGAAGCGRVRG